MEPSQLAAIGCDSDDENEDSNLDENEDSNFYENEDSNFDDDEDDDVVYCDDIERQITKMAAVDDKDGLVIFLRALWEIGTRVPDNTLRMLVHYNAVKSTEALLCGEGGWKFDVNVPSSVGTYPLHIAAIRYSITMIEVLIRHGASTDVVTNYDGLIYNGLLPLNVALEDLRFHYYLLNWCSEDSIFKLITILCLPQMKVPLEATRLLAQHTKETKEEFYLYAEDGHPIQMAVLLLVARDIVLAPFPDGIMSIRRSIEEEIASLDSEEVNMKGKARNSEPVRMLKDKKAGLHSALLLLHVFEKAGDAIVKYLQTKPCDMLSKDKVVEDVKSIFVEAGFDLKQEDTDLSDIKWETYHGWSSDGELSSKDFRRTTDLGSQLELGHPLPPKSQQGNVPGKIDICEQKWAAGIFFPEWTPTLSHKISTCAFKPRWEYPMLKTWYESPKAMGLLPSSKRFKATMPLCSHKHTEATMTLRPHKLTEATMLCHPHKLTEATMLCRPHLTSSKHYATITSTLMKGVIRL